MSTMTTEEWIEELKSVSVLELSNRIKALEEAFGVTAAAAAPVAAVAAPGAAPAADGGAPAEAAEEKTEFTVKLESAGDKKIQVIKVVRAVTGLGLKEAKELVDGAPSNIKEGIPKEEAEQIKSQVEEAGGQVTLE
jgi:large subunit ribosomal protein L7/L12